MVHSLSLCTCPSAEMDSSQLSVHHGCPFSRRCPDAEESPLGAMRQECLPRQESVDSAAPSPRWATVWEHEMWNQDPRGQWAGQTLRLPATTPGLPEGLGDPGLSSFSLPTREALTLLDKPPGGQTAWEEDALDLSRPGCTLWLKAPRRKVGHGLQFQRASVRLKALPLCDSTHPSVYSEIPVGLKPAQFWWPLWGRRPCVRQVLCPWTRGPQLECTSPVPCRTMSSCD